MLHPIHTFIHRIGRLVLLDRAADPAANGEVQRNATHVKVYSGGAVRSMSDLHAQLHATAHQPAGADAMAVDAAAATGSLRTIGTGALQAMAGNTATGGSDKSVRLRNSAAISLPNAVETTLTWDIEDFDPDNMHHPTTNTDRITFNTAGKYLVYASIRYASHATGTRETHIYLNGTATRIASTLMAAVSAGGKQFFIATVRNFIVGDFIICRAFQDSGGALDSTVEVETSPVFGAIKILG